MTDTAVQDLPVGSKAVETEIDVTTNTSESLVSNEEIKKAPEDKINDESKNNGVVAKKEEEKGDEESKTNGSATQGEGVKRTETTPERKPDSRNGDRGSKRGDRYGDRRGAFKGKNFKGEKYGSKFDPSSAKETDDPVEIRKQVEFYFSDSNLPNDRFLFESIGGSKNNPVAIETIHSFKRMRRFQPLSAVVAALKESSTLDVVDKDTAIRRKIPLPEGTGSTQPEFQKVFEDRSMSRSIYVKGFGIEEPSTQFDIEAWFSKYGATNQVRLRRTDKSSFKGSVFVEFDSEDTAKEFLSLDPAPKYNDRTLIIKSKKQYCDEKVDDLNAGVIRAREPDERDWKARRDNDRKNGFPSLQKDGRDGRNRRGSQRGGRGRGGRNDRDRDSRGRDDRNSRDINRADEEDDRTENDKKTESKEPAEPIEEKVKDSAEAINEVNKNSSKTSMNKDGKTSESKKRERVEDEEDNNPVGKKSAVESEMTGGPEAVEKKTDE